MKERGKRTAMEQRNEDVSLYYSTPSEFTCRKHPSVSSGVGICPYCLNDRLVNLVCSECGEQRLSSCSCSDISPTRTSNAAVESVPEENVVRISSLIDEERAKQRKETKQRKTEEVVVFKRSSSSCVEINKRTKNHRFSKIGRFFRKINLKKERDFEKNSNNDSWGLDYNNDVKKLGVSRSRSLCSFRGKDLYCIGSEEDGSSYSGAFSAARSSSVNGGLGFCETEYPRKSNFEGRKSNFSETTEHRRSNFEGGRKSNFSETTTENRKSNFSESEPPRRSGFEARKSNFSETEYPTRRSNFSETEYNRRENHPPRRSNYEAAAKTTEQYRKCDSTAMNFTRRVMSMKESSYFTGGEEPGFIDLKFDSSGGGDVNDGVLVHGGGGSCRKDGGEMRKSRKSFKGWKWIFGHHHHHHQQHQLHHHTDS
ncbi:PREDICTED: uncharacterized protein LOC104790173 [Camelina sativa]|uniref:Uncharacterized protein LOC104790173 n=1 Tax=Camelina sativa TaxID=90675 RepID=A0ABM0ZDC8_CAMSA|nr:PREDICTED: uncharacterized protein LOC104790173 [Camelina sativa]